jgi:hypothetical protein
MFSVGRRACSYQRHCLTADTIKKLTVVRHWESKKEKNQAGDDGEEKENVRDGCEVSLTFGDAD